MCWGKGMCPNSRCNEELLYTDGTKVLSSKSTKYELKGPIWRGDVSLTIFNTNEDDETLYCCRIEVPGWFNDVKKNIRLKLTQAPTTTRRPITTTEMTTTTAVLPTTAMTTPDLTTRTTLQTRTTAALTTATTCPLTTPRSLPETTTSLLTAEPSTEGSADAESETFFLTSNSPRSTEETFGGTALPTSEESKAWALQSTTQASTWEMNDSVTFPQPRASETATVEQNKVEIGQSIIADNSDLLMIIVPSLGFVLCALTVAFFLRGKVMKTNCFQKHTRLDNVEENKDVLDDIQHGREDEDGLFAL